jgi:anti-sigma B factor antagonist
MEGAHGDERSPPMTEDLYMQLEIEIKAEDGRYVVIPRGEFDLVTQAQLKEAINELVVGGNVDIIVDLDETTFLDSTGLGALIGARRKTHAFMGSFAIVCTQERLLKLFRITSLDKVFAIRDTRSEALARPERAERLQDGQPA